MKEGMETQSTESGNTGWDDLKEVPFAGNTEKTPSEEQDDWDFEPRDENGLTWEEHYLLREKRAEEARLAAEKETRDISARYAAKDAFKAIGSIAGEDVAEQYRKRIPDFENASYEEIKPVVNEINQIVKRDWESRMTDVDSYQPGDSYHFICQGIRGMYKASEYDGNYASCSLLTDEIHKTYSGRNYGFIYSPEDIVAAGDGDINLENRATSDDGVMRTRSIPTIDSIDNILKVQREKMAEDPKRASDQYNEVGVRAGKPIGIFCFGDGKKGDGSYDYALELQELNPDLKIVVLPRDPTPVEDRPQTDSFSETSSDWSDDWGDYADDSWIEDSSSEAETPSPAPSNTGWDELSEVPFTSNTEKTPSENQDEEWW